MCLFSYFYFIFFTFNTHALSTMETDDNVDDRRWTTFKYLKGKKA